MQKHIYFLVFHCKAVEVTLEGGARNKLDKKVEIHHLIELPCSYTPSQTAGNDE